MAIIVKQLRCSTVLVLVCIYCSCFAVVGAEETDDSIVLTAAEQEWLRAHPSIRIGVDLDWKPVEFVDAEGRHSGMSGDYVALLSRRLGLTMEIVPDITWTELIDRAKTRQLDAAPMVQETAERLEFWNFTQPYLHVSLVILARDDAPFIGGLESLTAEHSIAVVKGYANIKVVAPTPYKFDLAFGARSDWPELVVILDKGLASITQQEHQEIYNKWLDGRQRDYLTTIDTSAEALLTLMASQSSLSLETQGQEPSQEPLRILLAEDNQINQHIAVRSLLQS